MEKIETLKFMTILKSDHDMEMIKRILNSDDSVEYWNLKFNNSDYNLTIIGKQLKKVVNKLKREGYIAEVF